ncbi:MAG: cation diffusion facilitator family transporter [Bacillota bacterium]
MNAKVNAAKVSVFSNTVLVVMKLAVGFFMHSASVVAEGIHSGIDLVAAVIAYFSVKKASAPADKNHPYGHGKYENVSGAVEALLIFAAAIMIILESWRKLQGGVHMEAPGLGAAVMVFSAGVNFFVSRYLLRVAREEDSVALEADALHLRTDVYTSLGVFAGLVAIKISGRQIIDPIIAILVALLIIKAAWDLTAECLKNMVDVRLPDEEERLIKEVLRKNAGEYLEYHKLRTRKSGAERHIDLHVVVPKDYSVALGHQLAGKIKAEIRQELPNAHVLIHIEPCHSCCPDCQNSCSIEEEKRG